MNVLSQPENENLSYGRKLKEADSFSTAKQKAGERFDQEAEETMINSYVGTSNRLNPL